MTETGKQGRKALGGVLQGTSVIGYPGQWQCGCSGDNVSGGQGATPEARHGW